MSNDLLNIASSAEYGIINNIKINNYSLSSLYIYEEIQKITFVIAEIPLKEIQSDKFKIGELIDLKINEKKNLHLILEKKRYFNGFCQLILVSPIKQLIDYHAFIVFQNKKYSEAINEVCKIHNLQCDFKGLTSANDDLRELNMQYDENSLNFINRMCFFMCCYWQCLDNGNICIFSMDTITQNHTVVPEKVLNEFGLEITSMNRPFEYRNISYSSENPNLELIDFKNKSSNLSYYQERYSNDYTTKNIGMKMSKYISTSKENESVIFYDTGFFNLGFELKGLNSSNKLFIKKIEYFFGSIALKNFQTKQITRMEAVDQFNIPEFLPVKTKIQKATVVLPESGSIADQIYKDDKQRVLVCFHFDSKKQKIPVPVIQSAADNKAGSHFMPRVSEEVIIDFLHSDPGLPVLIGSLYNKANQHGFKIQETGWNFNYLDDAKAKNSIIMNNLSEEAALDFHSTNQMHFNIENKNMEIMLDGKKDEGNYKKTLLNGNNNIILKKGNYTLDLDDGDISINDKKGNLMFKLSQGNGDIILENGNLNIKVTGNINISATSNINISADQNILINAKQNIVMNAMQNITITSGQNLALVAQMAMSVNATQGLQVAAQVFNMTIASAIMVQAVQVTCVASAMITMQSANLSIILSAMFALNATMINVVAAGLCNISVAGLLNLASATIVCSTSLFTLNAASTICNTVLLLQGLAVIQKGLLFGLWIPG